MVQYGNMERSFIIFFLLITDSCLLLVQFYQLRINYASLAIREWIPPIDSS